MKKKLLFTAVTSALAMTGCANFQSINTRNPDVERRVEEIAKSPVDLKAPTRVTSKSTPLLPVSVKAANYAPWLSAKKITLKQRNTVNLQELLKEFGKEGVNIVSDLPLDRYYYSGHGLVDTDAETALRVVLGGAGLDYSVDSDRKLITVKPLSSKTWFLNIGNRKTSYAAGQNSTGGSSSSTTTSTATTTTTGTSGTTTPTGITSSAAGATTYVSSQDDFWTSLKQELDSRLKPLIPDAKMSQSGGMIGSPVPPPLPATGGQQASLGMGMNTPSVESIAYATKQIGVYSVNPETGAVAVQAPHWVLNELDSYFKRIQDMYNTDLTFEGEIITLTTENTQTEGFDLAAFSTSIKDTYGSTVGITNNALGGITVSGLTGLTPGSAVNTGINTLLPGLGSRLTSKTSGMGFNFLRSSNGRLDGIQMLNSYLSNLGQVNVVQKPIISTTMGTPGDFRRTIIQYYNTVTQQAASGGTGSAAVGTQNQLVPIELGTILRINPRVDIGTGLIRANISLEQVTLAGTQNVAQSLTAGDTVQQVTTPVPILSKIAYSGETLLKDGDVIIMGGQVEDNGQKVRDGMTGLMDGPLGGIFGKNTLTKKRDVFYFALKVRAVQRK